MNKPIPANENALCIAAIFEDFAIDHTPDGWPAVKQQQLNAAAQEIRRMDDLCVQLHDALNEIVSYWDSVVPTDCINDMHTKARAAIAKAEGGAA